MKLIDILKNTLIESTNVITEINKISIIIFDRIIEELTKVKDHPISELNTYSFTIDNNKFVIHNSPINKIQFNFVINNSPKIRHDIYYYNIPESKKISNDKINFFGTNDIQIGVRFFAPYNEPISKLIEELNRDKNKNISEISHELKHAFDYLVNPKMSVTQLTNYSVYYQLFYSEPIASIKLLFNSLLYLHKIEKSVFSTEVLSKVINDKNDQNELTQHKIVKHLNYIKTITYDTILNSLYYDEIDDLRDIVGKDLDISKMSDYLVVQYYLYKLRLKMINMLQEYYSDYYHNNLNDVLVNDIINLDNILSKFTSKVTRNNYFIEQTFNKDSPKKNTEFFESLIKNFKFDSENLLKNISKKIYKQLN